MKDYFNINMPNSYEWVQMKRIAIKNLISHGEPISEICKIVNLNRQNVWRNTKLEIDEEIECSFGYHIHRKLYPIKQKTKVKWKKL